MRLLITGGEGRLATQLACQFATRHEVHSVSRTSLDVCSRRAVQKYVGGLRPDVILNCAAFNDVDGAELDAHTAIRVNALACEYLADASAATGALLVHFSTDFVFEGASDRPYTEEDEPSPVNTYGVTKLLGERLAKNAPRHYVMRLASVFGNPGAGVRPRLSAIEWMRQALTLGQEVRALTDRTVAPSYAVDVGSAIEAILSLGLPSGIYHCVSSDACTWYELANYLQELIQAGGTVVPVSSRDILTKARRPRQCAMSPAKLVSSGIPMPSWRNAVHRFVGASKHAQHNAVTV
jgi:dTDP-4-dehydrorhamnose reductase